MCFIKNRFNIQKLVLTRHTLFPVPSIGRVWLAIVVETSWASEASPTLGCSIEISRDIYIVSVVGQKALVELRGPNARMLKVSIGR